jgi:thiamine kinase-like enzyme
MPDTPGSANEITFDWLKSVIESCFRHSELAEMEIDSTAGDLGYLGSICRASLTYLNAGPWPDSVIIKFPALDESVLKDAQQLGAYKTESNFYRHLANEGVGNSPRYYCSVEHPGSGEPIIFIEDLQQHRFVKQTDGANRDDSVKVMKALAKLHGENWESTVLQSDWLGDIKDWGVNNWPLIESGFQAWVDNFSHFSPPRVNERLDEGVAAYPKVLARLSEQPCTLMHGDAHIRNLAFDDEGPESVRFYDWQLTCRGPAAYDVLYFFVNSFTVEDQNAFADELMHIYIESLNHWVPDYGLADLKRDMAYSSLTFWGFFAWLGNILPPNEATLELVGASTPRYLNMLDRLDSYQLLEEFS